MKAVNYTIRRRHLEVSSFVKAVDAGLRTQEFRQAELRGS
jgi:hypothetical protein